ncbi:MAG: isochorismatase family protein [Candidatus Woesearchaeota archaeon]|nr:MAG: isochorismatase family protein [Candidatus Woesearchaeota archaeon]
MKVIAYDVDTGKDFMNMNGALPVTGVLYRVLDGEEVNLKAEGLGADTIKPTLRYVKNYFNRKASENPEEYKRGGSIDRHFKWELNKSLEFLPPEKGGQGFPPHCMDGTEGMEKIAETAWVTPVYVEHQLADESIRKYSEIELDKIASHNGDIVFEKQHYDVFTNPAAEKILNKMNIGAGFVYGVATDWCVKAAVLGMRERGMDVYVIEDAIYAVNATKNAGKEAIAGMKDAGAKFIKSTELESILGG